VTTEFVARALPEMRAWEPRASRCRRVVMARSGMTGSGGNVFITYQPASRYWAFQGIEAAVLVVLAAALIAVTATVVLHRDA
jgi:hypothetical protein